MCTAAFFKFAYPRQMLYNRSREVDLVKAKLKVTHGLLPSRRLEVSEDAIGLNDHPAFLIALHSPISFLSDPALNLSLDNRLCRLNVFDGDRKEEFLGCIAVFESQILISVFHGDPESLTLRTYCQTPESRLQAL